MAPPPPRSGARAGSRPGSGSGSRTGDRGGDGGRYNGAERGAARGVGSGGAGSGGGDGRRDRGDHQRGDQRGNFIDKAEAKALMAREGKPRRDRDGKPLGKPGAKLGGTLGAKFGGKPSTTARKARDGSNRPYAIKPAASGEARAPRDESQARDTGPRDAQSRDTRHPRDRVLTARGAPERATGGQGNDKRAAANPRATRDTRQPSAPPRPAAPPPAVITRRPAAHIEGAPERIAKLLARAGIASRRDVEKLIAEGRVKLNDVVLETPATILTSLAGVKVDDAPVAAAEAARLFAFHKPSGLITAARDPAGRPTIYTALRNALPPGSPRVMPIGRLDFSTEGLLLLTNDGELKRAMELPSTGIPRTYRARAFGTVSQDQLEQLIEGVTIEGIHYARIDANLERRTGRNQWVEMTLTEGKNREVRRVLEWLGLEVSRLLRTAYGPFPLGDLPRGAAYEIPRDQVERFRTSIAKSLKSPARGAQALPVEPRA